MQLRLQPGEVPPGHGGGWRLDIAEVELSSMRAEQLNLGEDKDTGTPDRFMLQAMNSTHTLLFTSLHCVMQVAYMGHENAFTYAKYFLSQHNVQAIKRYIIVICQGVATQESL